MDIATVMFHNSTEWIKSRPKMDIEESATWFLLIFVYAHGLTKSELSFKWTEITPDIMIPQVNLAMVIVCLIVSFVILIEPLLPYKTQTWTRAARNSAFGQILWRFNLLIAFIFGMVAGFSFIVETVPTFTWLRASALYVGFAIFIVLVIKLAFFWRTDNTANRCKQCG